LPGICLGGPVRLQTMRKARFVISPSDSRRMKSSPIAAQPRSAHNPYRTDHRIAERWRGAL